jgi:ribose transport system permease protein
VLDSLYVIEMAMRHFFIRAEMGKNAGRKSEEVDEDYKQAAALAALAAPYRHAKLSAMKLAADPNNPVSGVVCGAINGALVVYGRLQPIIATLATGAVYHGLALIIRPVPGGSVEPALAGAFTTQIFDLIPTTLVIMIIIVLVVWVPFQLSTTGRGCYAIGSLESAAYMTGVAVRRSRLAAYVLSGLFAAFGGILLTAMTLSGDASATSGGIYTLSSIAAVVIGGTSLVGGVGGAIGSIFGAFVLREVSDLLFVFDVQPLVQPFIQGLILLGAVSLGAIRVLRAPNRLQFLGVGR